mmetsp:Transcript_60023/g.90478  ORF Transcript_60023/g.90478 Transcript_60023/m.90478 type:complete len:150 (-) Transcript_60023:29-478(-)
MELIKYNPDLYGPIWIYNTIFIVLFAAGNLNAYFMMDSGSFQYNFGFLPTAFGVVYIYGFGFPLIFWAILKCLRVEISFMETLCIFGYTCGILIPISLLCTIPNEPLQWLFLMLGMLLQMSTLVTNYWTKMKTMERKNQYLILGVIVFF